MVLRLLILLFLTLPATASSQEPDKEQIIPALYGEKNFGLYYGPKEPYFTKGDRLGRRFFESEQIGRELFYQTSQMDLYDLSEYFKDLETAAFCPNSELAEHYSYIRYLFRLAAISYLDEHLRSMSEISKKMKLEGVCEYQVSETLKTCAPQGEDMELFVKSAKVLSRNFDSYLVPFDFPFEKFSSEWIADFRQGGRSSSAKRRLALSCASKKCSGLASKEKLARTFGEICKNDVKLFQKLCSEKDEIYGISDAAEAYHVIASSDALKVINENGHGRGCLARFSKLMSSRELPSRALNEILSGVYEGLRNSGEGVRGRLFPAGSLRRFIKNGLASIFVEKKVEAKEKEKAKEEPVQLAALAPEPIKKILKPKKNTEAAPVKKETKKSKPKPRKSHFLATSEARKEFDLERVKVNMLRFKYDYIFNSKMLSFLDQAVVKFTTRKGLEEMKKYDKLGTRKGPVPLLFIKYLIEQERHQGLTNLTGVLGEDFYVRNNIDDPKLAAPYDYVRLRFEEDQDPPWQLYILEGP